MRVLWIVLRTVFAAAGVAAIIAQLVRTLENAADAGRDPGFVGVNFVSFFTIDSNILAVATLVIGAVLLARGGPGAADPTWYLALRLCAVTYMATTLVVYNALLRGIALPQGTTVPWSNEVLHVVAPAYLVVDWLLAPGRARIRWRALWIVVVFPIVWVVYTLVRGPISGFYPYPFLDPGSVPGGYGGVAVYVVLIAVLITLIGAGAVLVTRVRSGGVARVEPRRAGARRAR